MSMVSSIGCSILLVRQSGYGRAIPTVSNEIPRYFPNEPTSFLDPRRGAGPFAMKADAPPRAMNQRFGFACGLSATPAMTWAHRHDDVEVTLALGGRAIMEHGGRRYQLAYGTCVIFWAGIPHQLVDTDPGVSVRWLTVPLIDVLAWQQAVGDSPRTCSGASY